MVKMVSNLSEEKKDLRLIEMIFHMQRWSNKLLKCQKYLDSTFFSYQ